MSNRNDFEVEEDNYLSNRNKSRGSNKVAPYNHMDDDSDGMCDNSYIAGFIMPMMFNVLALICLKYRKDKPFRKGFLHGGLIVIVFLAVYIIAWIVALLVA